jgi:hypothetical protein
LISRIIYTCEDVTEEEISTIKNLPRRVIGAPVTIPTQVVN